MNSKKIVTSFLACFMLTGCTSKEEVVTTPEITMTPSSTQEILISVTLPEEYFSMSAQEGNLTTVEDYAAEILEDSDIETAEINADGSLTIVMSEEKYDAMVAEAKDNVNTIIERLTSDKYPAIDTISVDDAVTRFILTVNYEDYEISTDSVALPALVYTGYYYQILSGNENPEFEIQIVDKDTEIIKETFHYPEDWEEEEEEDIIPEETEPSSVETMETTMTEEPEEND